MALQQDSNMIKAYAYKHACTFAVCMHVCTCMYIQTAKTTLGLLTFTLKVRRNCFEFHSIYSLAFFHDLKCIDEMHSWTAWRHTIPLDPFGKKNSFLIFIQLYDRRLNYLLGLVLWEFRLWVNYSQKKKLIKCFKIKRTYYTYGYIFFIIHVDLYFTNDSCR